MILIRKRIPADDKLIFSSWMWSSFSAFKTAQTDERYHLMRERIAKALASGTTLVVCPAEDEGTILGWLCFHDWELDYAYTREASRREGICKALCVEAFGPMTFTCQNPTPRFKLIAPKLGCVIQEAA